MTLKTAIEEAKKEFDEELYNVIPHLEEALKQYHSSEGHENFELCVEEDYKKLHDFIFTTYTQTLLKALMEEMSFNKKISHREKSCTKECSVCIEVEQYNQALDDIINLIKEI